MTAILSSSSTRSKRAELRGYAILGFCLALTSGFVAEFWRVAPDQARAAGVAAQAADATGQPAKVRS